MDSVTQIALGAAVAAACVPKEHRRKALLIGAVLGTTPDLDVFIDYGDAVSNFTYHRGFTHSLFVLVPFALLLWAILKKLYEPVRSAPGPWLLAIMLTLVTHPLLDAHTAYGTQLFWPLTSPPVMWSTIFIIDPVYTIPLLIGVIAILLRPTKAWASQTLAAGLVLSTGYLAWTWSGKLYVEDRVMAALESNVHTTPVSNDGPSRIYTTPAPFNSLLWRIVVLNGDDYLEGYYSFLDRDRPIAFDVYPLNKELFAQVKDFWAAKRLDWFAQGFNKSSIIDDYLVISDLRMGFAGNYAFNHAVARMGNPHYHEIESILLPSQLRAEDLPLVWNRLLGRK